MREHGIGPIDLVVVNLYPFEAVTARPRRTFDGGDREHRHRRTVDGALGGEEPRRRHRRRRPRRLRARCSPSSRAGGAVSAATNRRLAQKAFALTARYDGAIADYLAGRGATTGRSRRARASSAPRRRTCATARTRTSARRSIATRRLTPVARAVGRRRAPAPGQGALVQQHRRRRRRARAGEGVPRRPRRSRSSTPTLRRRRRPARWSTRS